MDGLCLVNNGLIRFASGNTRFVGAGYWLIWLVFTVNLRAPHHLCILTFLHLNTFMSSPWSSHWQWLQAAVKYYFKAHTRYDVHSPFLSEWLEAVLEDKRAFYAFDEIEEVRQYWLRSPEIVDYTEDLGAGSRTGQGRLRPVKEMVRRSAVDQLTGKRLFRMLQFARPGSILELGTNLGFSAMFLRMAARNAAFVSIEGHDVVARLAKHSFKRLGIPAPEIRIGAFQNVLPVVLSDKKQLDFVWMDGDHRMKPTLQYFEKILPNLHADSVVAIGDIHWSSDMEQAWEQLKVHPSVRMSVDLFDFGVLFFRKEQKEPEHFTLIPYKWKPWRLGFF